MVLSKLRRMVVLGASVALIGAGPALAGTKVVAPPGKAGATEYSETIPTSGGNVAPPNRTVYTGAPAPVGTAPVAKLGVGVKGLRRDAKLGSTGQAAAGFAESTAPPVTRIGPSPRATSQADRSSGTATPAAASFDPDSGSALGAVTHLLGGGDAGGIGILLPLALAFTLGLACGAAILRGRGTQRA